MKFLMFWILFFSIHLQAASNPSCEAHLYASSHLDKLIRDDRAEWLKKLEELLTEPTDYELYEHLPAVIQQMPVSLKNEIRARIRTSYGSLAKIDIDPSKPYPIAPKRAIDTLTSLMDHPHAYFRERKGKIPVSEIYTSFVDRLQTQTLRGQKGYAEYSGHDAIRVYKRIQNELRTHQTQNPQNPNPTFFIAGSFPNGRAHALTSDIDASLKPRHKELSQKLKQSFNEELSRAGKTFELYISLFDILSPGHLAWNSQVNPLNVFITAEKIEIWIYPVIAMDPQQLFVNGSPLEPDIYRLDEE